MLQSSVNCLGTAFVLPFIIKLLTLRNFQQLKTLLIESFVNSNHSTRHAVNAPSGTHRRKSHLLDGLCFPPYLQMGKGHVVSQASGA